MHKIDWDITRAAIWRSQKHYLRAIQHIDSVKLSDLVGIEKQKHALSHNTQRFLNGQPANNALLWGARGTGKSSLIKAILNEYSSQGLRLIEVSKYDLLHLPDMVDDVRDSRYKFIIFCDDLSFEVGDPQHQALRSVLEGSVELPPDNLLVYATSNRRHLVPESIEDNRDTLITRTEIHYSDAVEEKLALSDRFGLSIAFHSLDQDEYLAIVDSYFAKVKIDKTRMQQAALLFALTRGVRSGRVAKQFYKAYDQN